MCTASQCHQQQQLQEEKRQSITACTSAERCFGCVHCECEHYWSIIAAATAATFVTTVAHALDFAVARVVTVAVTVAAVPTSVYI
jgi:hypothetical protein